VIDFNKCDGLIPTIVCDAHDGSPRMLAYSTRESLDAAVREGAGIYWSRSRQRLWRKGESSGCTQRLISVATDCDGDALIFYVEQRGPTCHLGNERCFANAPFSWSSLKARVHERAQGENPDSYTRKLLADPTMLESKLVEEAHELADARTPIDVAWECADLLYFMTVKMEAAGIGMTDVMAQLAARAR
jgi:phosphoribosyl-ATP pyrophosphohydrolase